MTKPRTSTTIATCIAWVVLAGGLVAACKLDFQRMLSQRRVNVAGDDPQRIALVEKGGPPAGSVPHQTPELVPRLGDGCAERDYVETVPVDVSAELVARGRAAFDRVCATCHGANGDGVSPVAQAMEKTKPPSLLLLPVRDYPAGRIFRTVMVGYKLMPSYRDDLSVLDAWAVTAYVKSLAFRGASGNLGAVVAATSPGPLCPGEEP